MIRLLATALLWSTAFLAFAVPSVEDVKAEVAKGNIKKALQMMRNVVDAKPGSARAHYVYARLLAQDLQYDMAAEQIAAAREIDPALQFAQPERVREFEEMLEHHVQLSKRSIKPNMRLSPESEIQHAGISSQMNMGSARNIASPAQTQRINSDTSGKSPGGACDKAAEACAVESCRNGGGSARSYSEGSCRFVSCAYSDSSNNFNIQVSRPTGATCAAGYVK